MSKATHTAAHIGSPCSELLGLRWEDIDREQRCIHIRQGLVIYRSTGQEKLVTASDGLKNKFRRRTISITEAFLWQRLRESPTAVESGGQIIPTGFVFHSPEEKAYQPNNWAHRVFRPFMRALHAAHPDIPVLTPHELRHTRATLWIAQGMDPYMAARLLGRSDLKMLTKIYDHTSPEPLRKALLKARNQGAPPSGASTS